MWKKRMFDGKTCVKWHNFWSWQKFLQKISKKCHFQWLKIAKFYQRSKQILPISRFGIQRLNYQRSKLPISMFTNIEVYLYSNFRVLDPALRSKALLPTFKAHLIDFLFTTDQIFAKVLNHNFCFVLQVQELRLAFMYPSSPFGFRSHDCKIICLDVSHGTTPYSFFSTKLCRLWIGRPIFLSS